MLSHWTPDHVACNCRGHDYGALVAGLRVTLNQAHSNATRQQPQGCTCFKMPIRGLLVQAWLHQGFGNGYDIRKISPSRPEGDCSVRRLQDWVDQHCHLGPGLHYPASQPAAADSQRGTGLGRHPQSLLAHSGSSCTPTSPGSAGLLHSRWLGIAPRLSQTSANHQAPSCLQHIQAAVCDRLSTAHL